jgi:hypothetical protein
VGLAVPCKNYSMLVMKKFLIPLFTFLVFFPFVAGAVDKTPIGKPVSAWLVGPSQASPFGRDDTGQGCLMVSEFDNGIMLGFHARAAGIVGMTIDTGKSDRPVGQITRVGLNLGQDAYVFEAVASDASTLSFDLASAGGGRRVAERLTGLAGFRVLIDKAPYYFATTGFGDGLARLQACMGGVLAVTVPVSNAPRPLPVALPQNTPVSVPVIDDATPKADQDVAQVNAVPPVLNAADIKGVWGAAKGESLASVLEAWGLMAGVPVKTALEGDLILPRDVRYESSFNEAVQQLLGLFSGANRPVGMFKGNSVASALASPAPVAVMQKRVVKPKQVWQALAGTSLRDAFDHWGRDSGVKIIWLSDASFALPQSVKVTGRFEDAVQTAIGLYKTHGVRPLVQLNTDPQTGEKALIVKSERIAKPK